MPNDTDAEREALCAFVDELIAERDRLLRQLEHRETLEREASAALAEPGDDADQGSIRDAVDRTERLAERAARRVDEIERFRGRVAQRRAALCGRGAAPIELARLRVLPGTMHCAECAHEIERERRAES